MAWVEQRLLLGQGRWTHLNAIARARFIQIALCVVFRIFRVAGEHTIEGTGGAGNFIV